LIGGHVICLFKVWLV